MLSIKRLKFFFSIYSYFPKHKNWEPTIYVVCSLLEEAMWDHMRDGELCLLMADPDIPMSGLAVMEKTP